MLELGGEWIMDVDMSIIPYGDIDVHIIVGLLDFQA